MQLGSAYIRDFSGRMDLKIADGEINNLLFTGNKQLLYQHESAVSERSSPHGESRNHSQITSRCHFHPEGHIDE